MKSMDDVITLVAELPGELLTGNREKPVKKESEIFATVESITRTEFYAAKREGIKLAVSISVNPEDFKEAGEIITQAGIKKASVTKVIIDDIAHRIVRTFEKDDAELVIICEGI